MLIKLGYLHGVLTPRLTKARRSAFQPGTKGLTGVAVRSPAALRSLPPSLPPPSSSPHPLLSIITWIIARPQARSRCGLTTAVCLRRNADGQTTAKRLGFAQKSAPATTGRRSTSVRTTHFYLTLAVCNQVYKIVGRTNIKVKLPHIKPKHTTSYARAAFIDVGKMGRTGKTLVKRIILTPFLLPLSLQMNVNWV